MKSGSVVMGVQKMLTRSFALAIVHKPFKCMREKLKPTNMFLLPFAGSRSRLCICVLILFLCFSETTYAGRYTIGIKGGFAQTYVRNNVFFIPATPVYRGQFGVSYTVQPFQRFNYGMELLADYRGFTRDDYVNNNSLILEDTNMYAQRTTYSYISAPLFIGYRSKGTWYYFGKIGYSYSRLLNVKTSKPQADKYSGLYTHDSLISMTKDVKRNDHAWFAEIGGGLEISSHVSISLSVRNTRSFISHPYDSFYPYYEKTKEPWFYVKHRMFILFLELKYAL